jgi:hypothetical protein
MNHDRIIDREHRREGIVGIDVKKRIKGFEQFVGYSKKSEDSNDSILDALNMCNFISLNTRLFYNLTL